MRDTAESGRDSVNVPSDADWARQPAESVNLPGLLTVGKMAESAEGTQEAGSYRMPDISGLEWLPVLAAVVALVLLRRRSAQPVSRRFLRRYLDEPSQ